MAVIHRVSFPSKWKAMYDTEKTGVAEFRLGEGPCGKTVTKIETRWESDCFVIRQYYQGTDNDYLYKDFIYRKEDITGRIEITYGI